MLPAWVSAGAASALPGIAAGSLGFEATSVTHIVTWAGSTGRWAAGRPPVPGMEGMEGGLGSLVSPIHTHAGPWPAPTTSPTSSTCPAPLAVPETSLNREEQGWGSGWALLSFLVGFQWVLSGSRQ